MDQVINILVDLLFEIREQSKKIEVIEDLRKQDDEVNLKNMTKLFKLACKLNEIQEVYITDNPRKFYDGKLLQLDRCFYQKHLANGLYVYVENDLNFTFEMVNGALLSYSIFPKADIFISSMHGVENLLDLSDQISYERVKSKEQPMCSLNYNGPEEREKFISMINEDNLYWADCLIPGQETILIVSNYGKISDLFDLELLSSHCEVCNGIRERYEWAASIEHPFIPEDFGEIRLEEFAKNIHLYNHKKNNFIYLFMLGFPINYYFSLDSETQ